METICLYNILGGGLETFCPSWERGQYARFYPRFRRFIPWIYYRAMLCISAYYAVARCLSVRLSHAGIVSKRLNIFSNFSPVGSSTILVQSKRYGNIPMRTPYWERRMQGYEKNGDFRPVGYLSLSRKWYKISYSYYGMRMGNRAYAFE